MTFYNENEPFAADWLENLAAHDQIAPGIVDRRSIVDLTPADLAGHAQCHFFAGIGGWQLALRRAGIADDANVWTGSCPCQPFSDAGQGRGLSDPRHLWPAWFALIEQCRPPIIFGEQVASSDGLAWLDLVYADLERCGYTVGSADLCAAGVGAPHQRQRLFFVAHASGEQGRLLAAQRQPGRADAQAERRGEARGVADTASGRRRGAGRKRGTHGRPPIEPDGHRDDGGVANPSGSRRKERRSSTGGKRTGSVDDGASRVVEHASSARGGRDAGAVHGAQGQGQGQGSEARRIADIAVDAGTTRGFWADADWILCRDPAGGSPVARPVEPGTFPLAHGVSGRVGLIRGYGNAINIEVAVQFILASLEAISS